MREIILCRGDNMGKGLVVRIVGMFEERLRLRMVEIRGYIGESGDEFSEVVRGYVSIFWVVGEDEGGNEVEVESWFCCG